MNRKVWWPRQYMFPFWLVLSLYYFTSSQWAVIFTSMLQLAVANTNTASRAAYSLNPIVDQDDIK